MGTWDTNHRGASRPQWLHAACLAVVLTNLAGCAAAMVDASSPSAPPELHAAAGTAHKAPVETKSGLVYYFSDCQAGATAGCVPGNNSNAGTRPNKPKQNLAGLDLNALPAGTQLLFARGGAWINFNVQLRNLNVTPTRPLVFDSYAPPWGGVNMPWLKAGGMFFAFQFGSHGDTANDGGYTIRNLKLDGVGKPGAWGLHLRYDVRNVVIENVEITGFELGVHSQNSGPVGNNSFTLRNSNIHHNSEMGMLGDAHDMVIEGNTFANNNFSGSAFNHGIYLGGHGRNGVIRANTFTNNSAVNGVCTGGNLTVHGQWDGLLIEGNTITQAAASGGCYGISVNGGYDSPEFFRNLVIRANTVVDVGGCAICLTSAPGVVVENNVIVHTQPTYLAAILIPVNRAYGGDDQDGGSVIRNNTVFFSKAAPDSQGVALRLNSGSNIQVVSNLIYFGPDARSSSCFVHGSRSDFAAFDNNLCHNAGQNPTWSRSHRTLVAAKAAGFDANGLSGNPLLAASPSSANKWRCQLSAASPAANAGHVTRSSARTRAFPQAAPDIGACEREAK